MNPRVKICGITTKEDALRAAECGADLLGFIFAAQSPRSITPEAAGAIIAALPAYVTPVGVFVNERREEIARVAAATGIRIVQLSGDETPDDCAGLSAVVWKAFRFTSEEETRKAAGYRVGAYLLDGARDGAYGGTGLRADPAVAVALKQFGPLVLAGGLNPDNIVEAVRQIRPYAVDLNSGLEESPGRKDHRKLALLFERLSRAA
jgi:phosphoribosylanthranilate isomerase